MLRKRYDNDELSDNALVVRGGRLNILDIAFSLDKCLTQHSLYGLSVFAADVPTYEELCRQATSLPHPTVSYSTAGRLRAIPGVTLLATLKAPHYTLVLPDSEADTIERVRNAFDKPVANPVIETGS